MNSLEHIDAFNKALKNYTLSDSAREFLEDLRLVLLVAPSSSGRNTIIRELVKTGEFHFIISDTTRKPRENDGVLEQNGREYWFRTEEEALEEVRSGEFLEAAVIHNQQVSGISIRELKKAHDDNKIAITDVEVVGADNIHRAKPDAHIVFVIPPDFGTWIKRLHHRGALPEDEVRRRLESALQEFRAAIEDDYYTFVINDDLHDAAAKIYEIAKLGIRDHDQQLRGRTIVEQLLNDTEDYLNS